MKYISFALTWIVQHRSKLILAVMTIATLAAIISAAISLTTLIAFLHHPIMQKPVHWTVSIITTRSLISTVTASVAQHP